MAGSTPFSFSLIMFKVRQSITEIFVSSKTQLYSYFHSEVYSEKLQTKIQIKGTYPRET